MSKLARPDWYLSLRSLAELLSLAKAASLGAPLDELYCSLEEPYCSLEEPYCSLEEPYGSLEEPYGSLVAPALDFRMPCAIAELVETPRRQMSELCSNAACKDSCTVLATTVHITLICLVGGKAFCSVPGA